MSMRRRKLIGAFAMLTFVVVYGLVAMVLVQGHGMTHFGALAQALIYAVLGLAWILPLMPLIRWMQRPDDFQAG